MAKTILIVDDEPDLLVVIETRLETLGYGVLRAGSSEEALKVMKRCKPDLILLDLLLPNMQGDALCKKLRSDPRSKHIPIIIFTARISGIPCKAKEIGADDYLMKPFEPEDLFFKIKRLIG